MFSNLLRYHDPSKSLIASGVKLEEEKIMGNYCIALKNRFPELCHRFDWYAEFHKIQLQPCTRKRGITSRYNETLPQTYFVHEN